MSYWIGVSEAAEMLGVSKTTVRRSLRDEVERAEKWGEENVGWRHKPLTARTYQLSRERVERLAGRL
jgi:excisionase family DNA binding protein